MSRKWFLLAALALTACAVNQPPVVVVNNNVAVSAVSGRRMMTVAPGRIPAVTFTGANPVARRAFGENAFRWVEVLRMRDGAVIRYVRLKSGTFPGDFTDTQALKVDMAWPFFRRRGIVFKASDVRRAGPVTYIAESTDATNCFLFHVNFGNGGPRGDQQLTGNGCYPVTIKSASELKAEMLGYLSRLRVNGAPLPDKKGG